MGQDSSREQSSDGDGAQRSDSPTNLIKGVSGAHHIDSPLLLSANHKAAAIARGLTIDDGLQSRAVLGELANPNKTTLILLDQWMLPRILQRLEGERTPLQIYRTLYRTLAQTGLDYDNVPVILEDAIQLKSPPREGGLIFMPSHLAGSEFLKTFLKRIDVDIVHVHPMPRLTEVQPTRHQSKRGTIRQAQPHSQYQSHFQAQVFKHFMGGLPVTHLYMVSPIIMADLIDYIRHVNPKQLLLTGEGAHQGKTMLEKAGIQADLLQGQKQFRLL